MEHCHNSLKQHFNSPLKNSKMHAHHHLDMLRDFKRRLIVSLVVTFPILVLSPFFQLVFSYSLVFPYTNLAIFSLASFVFFYGGWPFLKGFLKEMQQRLPGMMTLIALAILVSYTYSSYSIWVGGKTFFVELTTLIDIMLFGHFIEMKSVSKASRFLESLASLLPSSVHLIQNDGSIKMLPIDDLKVGDKILIKPGEKIPIDGEIYEGASEINLSLVTGESEPVLKKAQDQVIGGAVNGQGALKIKVTKKKEESYISQVIEMIKKSAAIKSENQDVADKAAFYLTVTALISGAATLIVWFFLKDFSFALERMVTVMVIACPHALGLAIPLVIAVISGLSAKNGILIRNRKAFEEADKINIVVFDKTGTLTKGEFEVVDVLPLGSFTKEAVLQLAASIEADSEHSIGKSIVKAALDKGLVLKPVKEFKTEAGKGAFGKIDDNRIFVGKSLGTENLKSEAFFKKDQNLEGKTIISVFLNDQEVGLISLQDTLRKEAKQVVGNLRKSGRRVAMITGDNEASAKKTAKELSINEFFAGVVPEEKSQKIEALQKKGLFVAMVGDGINDAPALTQADLGIAIGAGTDVAIQTADLVLVKNDLSQIINVIEMAKITKRKMVQNLFWATGYNIIAIPLAAGVLFPWGIILSPAVGAVIMSFSTVIVALNSRLISRKKR